MELFPSNKLWNEGFKTYIEIGLNRLPLFYEKGSSGTSFMETVELPIDNLTYQICRNLKEHGEVKNLMSVRSDLAVDALIILDKTYANFLKVIDRDSRDEDHKAKLLEYATNKHSTLEHKISKYIITKDVI